MSECKQRPPRPDQAYCDRANEYRTRVGLWPLTPDDFVECQGCWTWGTLDYDGLCYDCNREEERREEEEWLKTHPQD